MKKYFYSMVVMAIFAIGFAASGDNEEETYVDEFGHKYHKKILKCVKCGDTTWYWEADDGSGSVNKPSSMHFHDGKYYCGSAYKECFPD